MQSTDGSIPRARPAWPWLLGCQLVVAAALLLAWRATASPAKHDRGSQDPDASDERILALEPALAARDLDAALVINRRAGRALLAQDESRTASFLSLTASAAGLISSGVDFSEVGTDLPAVSAVDVQVELLGDAYDLPVFLDGLHRQSAIGRVAGVAAVIEPGGAARAWVVVRYHRPNLPDLDQLAQRATRAVPDASPQAQALLGKAALLAAWRDFAAHAQARADAAEAVRTRLGRELAPGLVQLRIVGGSLTWSPASGLDVQPLAEP